MENQGFPTFQSERSLKAGSPTLLIILRCKISAGTSHSLTSLRAVPNMGASIYCVSSKVAKRLYLTVCPNLEDYQLYKVEDEEIKTAGVTTLNIQDPAGGWVQSTALVCLELADNMLLTWVTKQKLGLLLQG